MSSLATKKNKTRNSNRHPKGESLISISDYPIERYFPNTYDAFADTGYLKYSQVFEDKIGFKPNLSILDLLFNAGPQTKSLLQDFNTKPSLKTMV